MTAQGAAFDGAAFDAAADTYDADPHHALIADLLVADLLVADLRIAGLRPPPRPALVVDVATGTGFAAFAALRDLAPERIVALDCSPRMVERGVAKAAAAADPDGRIEWQVADAVPLDIPDGSVDVVLCASALHLLGMAALRDWRRVLRPGGRAAFSIPLAADFHPSPDFRALVATDLVIPADEAAAARLARDAGLTAVRVRTTPPQTPDRPRRALLV